jgi:hypothetical protein
MTGSPSAWERLTPPPLGRRASGQAQPPSRGLTRHPGRPAFGGEGQGRPRDRPLTSNQIARWGRGVKGEVAWLRLAEDAVEHERVVAEVELGRRACGVAS